MTSIEIKESHGLKYAIDVMPRPQENGIVFFTQAELNWMREQNFSVKQFRYVWQSKHEDHNYTPIPLEKDSHSDQYKKPVGLPPKEPLAQKYTTAIINDLKKKVPNVETAEPVRAQEDIREQAPQDDEGPGMFGK